MLNELAVIERPNYKVHFRSYSDKLYGYRIFVNGECHYIINDRLNGDMAISTLYRLKDLSAKYRDFGYVMLQEDNKVYVDYDYRFNHKHGDFVHDTSSKVVDINRYKYTLHHGIDKYKDRWDSE